MNRLLLVLATLLIAPGVWAQDDYYKDVPRQSSPQPRPVRQVNMPFHLYLGAKGGPTWTRLLTDPNQGQLNPTPTYRTGLSVGTHFLLGAKFNGPFSLQVEPGYFQKRSGLELRNSVQPPDTLYEVSYQLEYFSLPIVGKYEFALGRDEGVSVYGLGGIGLNFVVNARERIRLAELQPDVWYDYEGTNRVEATELNLTLGAGLQVPLYRNRAALVGEYRLLYGITNMNRGILDVTLPGGNRYYALYQLSRQASIGVQFFLF
ncbi:Outer membrane protein beta-barrel domain-containing protein [Catalinimonas alkaloidigena]|uniref:Outer membrane protein beta-barrel domain-containing protein n=1 Tax=Catalinimonas alkaloidigena TaxID=1075417 RepID=A0A1G8WJA4_9BACT|nr:outer membrane beta-barrel protein [Catalinimonas alkaloidigena]SDJ78438.1 Outer membrane protein beta-barrel domain-containing protein [Catalinimonas alkaloidigena]